MMVFPSDGSGCDGLDARHGNAWYPYGYGKLIPSEAWSYYPMARQSLVRPVIFTRPALAASEF
jgi:hypothetical protein